MSNDAKLELGDELINLVQHAYSKTKYGSMINSLKDVIPSHWNVYDWDEMPGVDACVFYRTDRSGETWRGFKIQGIGHDGKQHSKEATIKRLERLLGRTGWWIESSDAMRHILHKTQLRPISDERLLQQLFPHSNLQMIDEYTYTRNLTNGDTITESVFGNPVLRGEIN